MYHSRNPTDFQVIILLRLEVDVLELLNIFDQRNFIPIKYPNPTRSCLQCIFKNGFKQVDDLRRRFTTITH